MSARRTWIVIAALAAAGACADGGKDDATAGSGSSSGSTGSSEATAGSGDSSTSSASATSTSTATSTSSASSTSSTDTTSTASTDATSTSSTDTTTDDTTGPDACEAIVGSTECEALVRVSGDLTLEECLLCQGATCGVEPTCDGYYPCVDGAIVLQGCCTDAECEGFTPFCGMYTGTNNVCVLSDDV